MKLTFNDSEGKFTSYDKPIHVKQQLEEPFQVIIKFRDSEKKIPCKDKEYCDAIYNKIIENIDANLKSYFILPPQFLEKNTVDIITKAPEKISTHKLDDKWELVIDGVSYLFDSDKEFQLVFDDLLKFIGTVNDNK